MAGAALATKGVGKKSTKRKPLSLDDIKRRDQFQEYYSQNGLVTTAQKIKNLMNATGVNAIRGTVTAKQKETLESLEEFTILGHWRFFNDKK